AFGIALGMRGVTASEVRAEFARIAALLAATRPTEVNLFWAIDRMRRRLAAVADGEDVAAALLDEARRIKQADLEACRKLGDLGAALLPDEARVLTHCNA